jgi:ABC-type amino acid transport substrate-binding protein
VLDFRPRRTRLAPVLLGLLVACSSSPDATPSPGLSRIAQTREVRIATSGEQPPLTMTTRNGELVGLDVALGRVLAQSMGVEPIFVQLPFGQLLDALEAGNVDLVMSGMTITPDRGHRATFVGPYYTSGKSLLTKSEALARIEVPEDLDSSDHRLAALAGSTSEAFLHRSLPQAQAVLVDHVDQGIQKVLSGDVDALIADRETCAFAVLRHPDQGLIASEHAFTVEPMGIAVPVDDQRLANLIQSYLTALRDSGALQKATAFWFRDPSWVKDLR